jgi:CheY-like chemotaxis protein
MKGNEPKINILLADDKREICESLDLNLQYQLKMYNLKTYCIQTVFTSHACQHGKQTVANGFLPNICIFDLIFNGDTGLDLYNYIKQQTPSNYPLYLCIYTGTEKLYQKRQEAEILASTEHGNVKIVQKPNINEILSWFHYILSKKYHLDKKIENDDLFMTL